jgi:hypothetical protein
MKDFELRKFQEVSSEANRELDRKQNEFCELVNTEFRKMSAFQGTLKELVPGANYVFTSHLSFDGIPVVMKFYLDLHSKRHLDKITMSCNTLNIYEKQIPCCSWDDFKIYCHNFSTKKSVK